MYQYIIHPKTYRKMSIFSKNGKRVIHQYMKQLGGDMKTIHINTIDGDIIDITISKHKTIGDLNFILQEKTGTLFRNQIILELDSETPLSPTTLLEDVPSTLYLLKDDKTDRDILNDIQDELGDSIDISQKRYVRDRFKLDDDGNVIELDISGMDKDNRPLETLPPSIVKLQYLKTLKARFNKLTEAPSFLVYLKPLEFLDLRMNTITTFPSHLYSLPQLETLFMSKNHIQSIPDTMYQFKTLKTLSLHSNQITSIPKSFGDMEHLMYLGMCNNHLSTIPKELYQLTSLMDVNLSENQLQELPNGISNLQSLESLNLNNNQITHLPNDIAYCNQLIDLTVEDNQLNTLPDIPPNIEFFNISNNSIDLPQEYKNLRLDDNTGSYIKSGGFLDNQ